MISHDITQYNIMHKTPITIRYCKTACEQEPSRDAPTYREARLLDLGEESAIDHIALK